MGKQLPIRSNLGSKESKMKTYYFDNVQKEKEKEVVERKKERKKEGKKERKKERKKEKKKGGNLRMIMYFF